MRIRNLLGLSAIGAAYYAHRRRGGELTLDSVRDSINALGQWVQDKATQAKDKLAAAKHEDPTQVEQVFPETPGFPGGDGLYPGR